MTYTCSICHEENHVNRVHCKACGTIPARYSPLAKPAKNVISDTELYAAWDTGYITVHVAFGCERQDIGHTAKRLLRTVPMDYYAEV